ncbi:hypothetical protein SEVIR_3G313545v4 [Setaria viridis]
MFPFQFKRKQFPIRLSFAMTVNKAQVQTIPNISMYLREPVFSHGQLYIALSRATTRLNIKVLALPSNREEDEENDEKEKKRADKNTKNNVNKNEKKRANTDKKKNAVAYIGTFTKNIVYKKVLTCTHFSFICGMT